MVTGGGAVVLVGAVVTRGGTAVVISVAAVVLTVVDGGSSGFKTESVPFPCHTPERDVHSQAESSITRKNAMLSKSKRVGDFLVGCVFFTIVTSSAFWADN